jgi:RimJ/RimL family protein N-acetyltransferase
MTAPTATPTVTLRGPRVVLRPWRLPEDLAPLFAINGDPEAMRFFPGTMTRAESDDWVQRIAADCASRPYGFWALELPGEGLVGAVGIKPVAFEADFTPGTEIGWRIATRFQRRGLAEEAARLALAFGFGPAGLSDILAFTPPANEPSWRLMEKLGMARRGVFEHPRLAPGHRLRRHLLYGIGRADWVTTRLGG